MEFSFFSPPDRVPQDIGILILPEFSLLCFASIVEPLRAANWYAGTPLYRWRTFTFDGEAATSSSGFDIQADEALSGDVPAVLLVCASYNQDRYWSPALGRSLRELRRRGVVLGGLDTGAFILARSGLLDGHRATVHWEDLDTFAEMFPNVDTVGDRYVADGKRVTAGGGTTALDLVLALIRAQHGHLLASEVASLFIYEQERIGTDPQRGIASRQLKAQAPALAKAMALMEDNVEFPLSIRDIADSSGVSQKELERLFMKILKLPPGRYYRNLRLTIARRFLQQTSVSVSEVAVRTGFNSSAAFARAYRAHYGKSPREERAQR